MKIAPTMWMALLALSFHAHAALEITEFSANSDDRALDEDGESADWIELWNGGNSPLSTAGYALTDERSDPTKWLLPDYRLDPGEFLLVFASGKDRSDPNSELHAGFSLEASRGYLALIAPDGTTAVSAFEYPRQFYGFSFGAGGYHENPTCNCRAYHQKTHGSSHWGTVEHTIAHFLGIHKQLGQCQVLSCLCLSPPTWDR